MNRSNLLILVVAVVIGTTLHVRSQAPIPASPLEALQTIKAQNQKTLDQQNGRAIGRATTLYVQADGRIHGIRRQRRLLLRARATASPRRVRPCRRRW